MNTLRILIALSGALNLSVLPAFAYHFDESDDSTVSRTEIPTQKEVADILKGAQLIVVSSDEVAKELEGWLKAIPNPGLQTKEEVEQTTLDITNKLLKNRGYSKALKLTAKWRGLSPKEKASRVAAAAAVSAFIQSPKGLNMKLSSEEATKWLTPVLEKKNCIEYGVSYATSYEILTKLFHVNGAEAMKKADAIASTKKPLETMQLYANKLVLEIESGRSIDFALESADKELASQEK